MFKEAKAYHLEFDYDEQGPINCCRSINRCLVQHKISMIEPLLILEYRLIEELCLLEVAVGRPGACTSNTLLVCAIGLLLSSAAAAVNLFVCRQFVYLLFENTNSYPPLSLLLVAPIMN